MNSHFVGVFAAARIDVSVGHMWLLFVLFQLARGTRRRRNSGTKKARRFRRASDLVGKSGVTPFKRVR